MPDKLVIKTNDDDWYELFYKGDLVWQDHRPPDTAWELKRFLAMLVPDLAVEIEVVEEFD